VEGYVLSALSYLYLTNHLVDYTCANCVKNSALSHSEKITLRVLLFTSGTTVASLLYFAHNFGLF
jgi:hypothetical protein